MASAQDKHQLANNNEAENAGGIYPGEDQFDLESELSDVITNPITAHDLYTQPRYMGMPAVYLAVGVIYGGQSAILYPIYQLILHKPQNYQNSLYRVTSLFWSFKIFYGFLSDSVPIFGYRRKPYLVFGFVLSTILTAIQAIYVGANSDTLYCFRAGKPEPPLVSGECAVGQDMFSARNVHKDNFDGNFFVALMFLTNFAYMFADVAADGLAVQYAQREPPSQRGRIQSYNYVCRFSSTILVNVLVAFSLNTPIYGGNFTKGLSIPAYLWILTIGQGIFIPFWLIMFEEKVDRKNLVPISEKFKGSWKLLQNRAFSSLMVFNVLYNMFTGIGVYASSGLAVYWVGVSGMMWSISTIVQYIAITLTVYINGRWFVTYSWRCLQAFGLVTATIMGILALVIVYDINRDPWFWIFTQVDTTVLSMIGWLTSIWACNEMAPPGLEGTALAVATTAMNAASTAGNFFTNRIGGVFETLNSKDPRDAFFNNPDTQDQYAQNLYIIMVVNMLALCFMWLLPHQKAQARRRYRTWGSSIPYGFLGLGIIAMAMLYGTITNLATLFCSCAKVWGGSGCVEGTCSYPADVAVPENATTLF